MKKSLSLLESYLSNRFQHVTIENHSSDPQLITTGVPQGSVLGPLLFSLYTSPISNIFTNSKVKFHLYADDTQLYIPFSCSDSSNSLSILSSTLDSVYQWLSLNRLSVNPNKTEYLLIGIIDNALKSLTPLSLFITYLSPQNLQCATLELSLILTYPSITTSPTHAAPPSIRFACFVKFVLPLISTLPFSLPMLLFPQNLTTAILCSTICPICPLIVFNVSKILRQGI